jgi:UDP-N-acetylglucosamine--N-acetylmuramyl-(pentapeptide) pyrophosphoryl-undecaprenol N-acetylglucosamine transferase
MLLEANANPKLLGALIAARLSDPDDLKARAAAAKSVARPGAAKELADMAERIAEL